MSDPNKNPDLPDFLNPETSSGGAAPKQPSQKAQAPKPGADSGLGDAADILLGSTGGQQQRRIVDADLDEPFDTVESKGRVGLVIFIILMLVAAGGVGYVLTNDKLKQDMECFFSGEVEKCKTAEKSQQEAKWREVDALTVNRYGSTELHYTPADAKVVITQLKWTEGIEDYVGRVKQGKQDVRGEPERIDIPNKTASLKENEIVESLPLQDVPLLEKSTDSVDDSTQIYTYAYEMNIEKEGYFPRTFLFGTDDLPMKVPEGAMFYKWENAGPGVFIANFGGADLMPKPETARPKLVKALIAIRCLQESPAGKKLSEEEMQTQVLTLRAQEGFPTEQIWTDVETALKENPEVWAEVEKEVAAGTCTE